MGHGIVPRRKEAEMIALYIIGGLLVAAISAIVPYCQEQRRLRNLMEFNAHRERGWPPLPYPLP